jgi:hypothetical protein
MVTRASQPPSGLWHSATICGNAARLGTRLKDALGEVAVHIGTLL